MRSAPTSCAAWVGSTRRRPPTTPPWGWSATRQTGCSCSPVGRRCTPSARPAVPCLPDSVGVSDDVDHHAVRIPDEEAPDAPGLLGEWVDDLVTAALGVGVRGV